MRTILDSAYTLFFDDLHFYKSLRILVSSGIQEKQTINLKIAEGVILNECYPVSITNQSKKYSITFEEVITWQVVDESYTSFDKTEEMDSDDFIKIFTKSKYLDYVNVNHGWYKYIAGEAKHYQLWTESDVIDVVACQKPKVKFEKYTLDDKKN